MIAAEFVRAPPTEELVVSDSLQVPNNYDDDDGDDALSLCNLSLYSDAAHYSFADDVASPSSSSSSSSSSLDHDDVFEFSSFGDSDSSSHLRSDDRSIVFCGKRIPLRESPPNAPTSTASPEDKRSPLRTGCGSRKSTSRRIRSPTVRRRKCRWYRMAFGLARFPTEMALSEMRTRQSRNAMKSGSCDGSGGGEIVRSGDESKGKGFFGLLKALGLGHRRRADALVKASFGCVPRV